MTAPVSGASGSQPQSQSDVSRTSLASDVESFLQLLTTQLKYQDPLSPMDSTQFTSQLAQFATVEQGINTNSNLESLLTLTRSNQAATALSYIGKTVEATGNVNTLTDKGAEYKYTLDRQSSATTIVIRNSANQVVYSTNGENEAGTYDFKWDGKDSNGNLQPAGAYSISVTTTDGDGNSGTAPTFIAGVIDGADMSGDSVNVMIGSVVVPFENIVTLRNPETADATTP
ncbi:MAG TPA: flagellar hook capping FlgD N-terminal domain-containing protein [Alphaproteobacteria bacterium]|jgi:flagellar basal-body rod modification protein FlgD